MENLPAVLTDISLGLDKAFFDKYQSIDEKQDLYAEIKKVSAASSWMLADFFRYLWGETDEKTLNKFSASVNEPAGTVNNYIRTSQAYTQEERNPMATFSHHFQASLADSYNSKTKTFASSTRFEWLEKAIDERWTTRKLNEEVQRTKKQKELGAPVPCFYCDKADGEIIPYNIYNTKAKHTDHLNFHEICYKWLLAYAEQKR